MGHRDAAIGPFIITYRDIQTRPDGHQSDPHFASPHATFADGNAEEDGVSTASLHFARQGIS